MTTKFGSVACNSCLGVLFLAGAACGGDRPNQNAKMPINSSVPEVQRPATDFGGDGSAPPALSSPSSSTRESSSEPSPASGPSRETGASSLGAPPSATATPAA